MWGNISTTFPRLMNKFHALVLGTPVAQGNKLRQITDKQTIKTKHKLIS